VQQAAGQNPWFIDRPILDRVKSPEQRVWACPAISSPTAFRGNRTALPSIEELEQELSLLEA
jgi:hypothetical protein